MSSKELKYYEACKTTNGMGHEVVVMIVNTQLPFTQMINDLCICTYVRMVNALEEAAIVTLL